MLVLTVHNILAPLLCSNYLDSVPSVTTQDDQQNRVDTTTTCSYSSIQIKHLTATFTKQREVGVTEILQSVVTDANANPILQSSDQLVILYEGVQFIPNSSSPNMTLSRGDSLNDVQLGSGDLSQPNSMTFTLTGINNNAGPLKIDFRQYGLTFPVSTSPSDFTFTFHTEINSQYYEYMLISAVLQAFPSQLPTLNIEIIPEVQTIGDAGHYLITFNITQPLSSNARVVLHFPPALDLSGLSTISSCSVAINAKADSLDTYDGVGSRSCRLLVSNSTLEDQLFPPIIDYLSLTPDYSNSIEVNITNSLPFFPGDSIQVSI